MSKILVGRDNPKEVEIGVTISTVAQPVTGHAETNEEEPVEEPVKDVEPAAEVEAENPEKAKAPVKGRGKKRAKA